MKSVYALQIMIRGMNLGKTCCLTSTLVCETCTEGLQYAAMLDNDAKRQTIKPLEDVHSGVCGPMRNVSMGGTQYFVTFVDDFLKKVWV